MAIICTIETNEIWSYILDALKSKGLQGTASSQTSSDKLTLLKTPLRTSELLELCTNGENEEIYVFFSPPSLVISSANSEKSGLAKTIIERTKTSEELLDLYYKFKHKLRLINTTFTFDSSNRMLAIDGAPIEWEALSCPLSYKDVLSYLAFNNQIEKTHKIEKLLNGVSHVKGAEIESLVNLTCERIDLDSEQLKTELSKNKEETSRLVEELAIKSKNFNDASEELMNIREKYKVIEKESALEKDRLEFTVYSLQTRLEESVKRHEAEVQEIIEKNNASFEEATLAYEKKIDLLNEKVTTLAVELSGSNGQCDAYKEKNIELAAQIKKLEESLFATQETLENFVQKSDSERRKANDKFQKLLTKSEDQTRKREQAEAEFALLKRDYEARLKTVKEERTLEVEKLNSFWKSEKVEIERNAELQVSAKNKELVTLKVTSERVIDKLERENKSLQKELKSYQALYHQVKNDLDAVKGSTTWKTLSPVLKVKDKVLGKNLKFDQDELISNIGLLYTSDLFDAEWYLTTYKDVAEQGLDPAKHYLLHGFKEGRRPSLNFDGNWYFNYYKDVKSAGFNPLVHFIKYGKAEGRKTSHNLLMNLDR